MGADEIDRRAFQTGKNAESRCPFRFLEARGESTPLRFLSPDNFAGDLLFYNLRTDSASVDDHFAPIGRGFRWEREGIRDIKRTPGGLVEDLVKRPQNFRFTAETIRRLGVAAGKYGMSRTAYTELALQDRFKKDQIA